MDIENGYSQSMLEENAEEEILGEMLIMLVRENPLFFNKKYKDYKISAEKFSIFHPF